MTLSSVSVVSVKCAQCGHDWSISMAVMSLLVRDAVQIAMLKRSPSYHPDH